MIGKQIKKLIIVCDEKTQEHANYLRQLISANDDTDGKTVGIEDGTVDAVVWLEKDYVANMATLSSREHVLFIGKNKTSKNEMSSIPIKFNEFGMRYGWLGKRGVLYVEEGIKKAKTYNEFLEFCRKNNKEYEKAGLLSSKLGYTGAAVLFVITPLTPVFGAVTLGMGWFANKEQKTIKSQQYNALTAIFYLEGLPKFMED